MNPKESKILAKLDKDSRTTTKDLGKLLRASQQSANYLLHKIEEENYFIKYNANIDSAKFGLSKVLVFYNYINFKDKRKIISHLKLVDNITIIEECSEGFDLMVEFTSTNLSSFNKIHREILHRFKDSLRQMEIFPVIVKHHYGRKYLTRTSNEDYIITSGDRNVEKVDARERMFLKLIQNNSREPVIKIASKMKCDSKTVIQVKKKLEKKKIIRRYSISLNTPLMNISRTHVLLNVDFEDVKDIDKLIEVMKRNNNIIRVQKIIGNYELFVTIEREDHYTKVLNKLRDDFQVTKYKTVSSENIIKETDIPESILK